MYGTKTIRNNLCIKEIQKATSYDIYINPFTTIFLREEATKKCLQKDILPVPGHTILQ